LSSEKYSHFKEYSLLGEFYLPEKPESRFPAKVEYSPINGLQLDYSIVESDINEEASCLFGILQGGKRCTLIGGFDFSTGTNHVSPALWARSGKHPFSFILFGDHLKDIVVNKCRFTFTNMQEFFFPQGHIDSLKYSKDSLETIAGEDWTLEIQHRATAKLVGNRLINLLHSKNDDLISELSAVISKTLEKHPNDIISVRNSLEFVLSFFRNSPVDIYDITKDIFRICSLFSLLTDRPTFPDEVQYYLCNDKGFYGLSNRRVENGIIAQVERRTSHHFMPINGTNTDLKTAISKWFSNFDDFYEVLSTEFQFDTGMRTLHSVQSGILMFVSNLEFIGKELGVTPKERYETPLRHYCEEKILKRFTEIIDSHTKKELGAAISDLRNDIAHLTRPKQLIHKIPFCHLMEIYEILRGIVAAHVLCLIGVPLDKAKEWQKRYVH
jgi:hypothetical protein